MLFGRWFGPYSSKEKKLLSAFLGKVPRVRANTDGRGVAIESMSGSRLGRFNLDLAIGPADPGFGHWLRERIRTTLVDSKNHPSFKGNLWPALFAAPVHVLFGIEGTPLLQEFDPHGAALYTKWLGSSTNLIVRVVPVERGSELLGTSRYVACHTQNACCCVCMSFCPSLSLDLFTFVVLLCFCVFGCVAELARTVKGSDLAELVKLVVAAQGAAVKHTPLSVLLMSAVLRSATSTTWAALLALYTDQVRLAAELVLGGNSAPCLLDLFDAMCYAINKLPHESLTALSGVFTPAALSKMLGITSGFIASAPNAINAVRYLFEAIMPRPRDPGFAALVHASGLFGACTKLLGTYATTDPSVRDCGSIKCQGIKRLAELLADLLWVLVGDKADTSHHNSAMSALLDDNVVDIALWCFIEIVLGANEAFYVPTKDAQAVAVFLYSATQLLATMRPKDVAVSRRFLAQVVPYVGGLLELAHYKCASINLLDAFTAQGLFEVLDEETAKRVAGTMVDVIMEEKPNSRRLEKAAVVAGRAPTGVLRHLAGNAQELVAKLDVAYEHKVPHFKDFVALLLVACKGTPEAQQAAEVVMNYLERQSVIAKSSASNLNLLFKLAKAIGDVAPDMKDRLVAWCHTVKSTKSTAAPKWLLKFVAGLPTLPTKRKADDTGDATTKRDKKDNEEK